MTAVLFLPLFVNYYLLAFLHFITPRVPLLEISLSQGEG